MTYTSISFFVFLSVVLLIYYILPRSARWVVLLTGSIAFYFFAYRTGWWVLLASILLTYAMGMCMEYLRKIYPNSLHRVKKMIFVAGVVFALLPWLCIKIGDFILGSILHRPLYLWIVPLGISFYTLQITAYLGDVFSEKIKAQRNLTKYMLFVLFFPQIVQGPIPRYRQIAGELYNGNKFDEREFVRGFQLILWGFFLKFMIANKAAVVVNEIFSHPDRYVGCYVLVAGMLYSIELYTDFLACTEICRGVAGLFGIHMEHNFMRPYMATSVKDFWRRWHMSLSSWLRDYIYIPLGGSKKGTWRRFANLVVTFAVSGIWHGASYKFLFWGLLHAIYQIVGSLTSGIRDKLYGDWQSPVRKMLQRTGVFFLMMTGWVIFRANSLKTGFKMLKNMFLVYNPWILFDDSLFSLGLNWKEWILLAASIAILAFVEHRQENGEHIGDSILKMHLYLRGMFYLVVILSTIIFGTYGFGFNAEDFIYRGF